MRIPTRLLSAMTLAAAIFLPGPAWSTFIQPSYLAPGDDYFVTESPTTLAVGVNVYGAAPDTDGIPALPAGFFGTFAGVPSDPWIGLINLQGNPLCPSCTGSVTVSFATQWFDEHGNEVGPDSQHKVRSTTVKEIIPFNQVDTIVRRKAGAYFDHDGATQIVPIEIIALSLTGAINVTYGGANSTPFQVFVDLAPDQIEGRARLALYNQQWVDDPMLLTEVFIELGPLPVWNPCDNPTNNFEYFRTHPDECLGLPVAANIRFTGAGQEITLPTPVTAIFHTSGSAQFIPEPGTLALLGWGFAVMGWWRKYVLL